MKVIKVENSAAKMSNTLIGYVEAFVPGGNFQAYADRVKQLIKVNKTAEDEQAALFITIMGADVYEILVSLVLPKLPSDLSFTEIMDKLSEHFKPKVNKRSERYKFNKIMQEKGESIGDFVVRLKAAAQSCEFGAFLTGNGATFKNSALEDALVDRFIIGLYSESIQQKLLNDTENDFNKVAATAISMEITHREVLSMKPMSQHAVQVAETYAHVVKSGQSKFNACKRCGRKHDESKCPAVNWGCFVCDKKGHTSVVCRLKNTKSSQSNQRGKSNGKSNSSNNNNNSQQKAHVKAVYHVEGPTTSGVQQKQVVSIKSLSIVSPAFTREVLINGIFIKMEIDSGAVLSLIPYSLYILHFSSLKLNQCFYALITVTGQSIEVAGQITVDVRGATQSKQVNLIVTTGSHEYTPLYGRAWLDALHPSWRENMFKIEQPINTVCTLQNSSNIVSIIKQKYPIVVNASPNQSIEQCEAVLVLKEDAIPIFHAPYSVPFKVRDRVKSELDKLVENGTLKQVKFSDWATPIIVVPKPNDDIRICMDCKVTINRMLRTEHYPLPKIEDIFALLSHARVFCVLDLKGAYQQVVVSKQSEELLTINTIYGLYRYTRLTYGISSAPSIFQQIMDKILNGLESVHCYLDDIIIGGRDEKDCIEILWKVLDRLNEFRVHININKCQFFVLSVKYLGHIIGEGKISPNPEKVKAVVNARKPNNLKELKTYLGLVNYYGKFIPNLSIELHSLYALTKKDVEYIWSQECQNAFEHSKSLITSDSVLELYDPSKQMIVASDASPIGLGAILSHEVNGQDKPVLFASSTLTATQQNYSQIHREALGIMFAVQKFHNYIYGHTFILHTDQQALSEIFHPSKGNSGVAAARLQRWSIILSMYNYRIKHRSATKMTHVDALSRFPIEEESGVETVTINMCSGELIDKKLIAKSTQEDSILSKVYEYSMNGWPSVKEIDEKLIDFHKKRNSLATEDNCVYYGNNVVIPKSLQKVVLDLLHENHVGMVKMKLIARSYAWWPSIQSDIESYVTKCEICQQTRNVPKEIVNSKWPSVSYPFERIHLDFFYLNGTTFLIVVDAYSKFVEIVIMKSTVVNALIEKLSKFFAIFGLPTKIVSDNGPPFNSNVFKKYCETNGIVCQNSPPYHAQSNGLAERGVQTAKKALIRFCLGNESQLSMQAKLEKYLMLSRHSPSFESGRSPAEIVFAYKPKVKLDLINDFVFKKSIVKFENNVKNNCDSETKENVIESQENNVNFKSFSVGDRVFYRCHFKSWVK